METAPEPSVETPAAAAEETPLDTPGEAPVETPQPKPAGSRRLLIAGAVVILLALLGAGGFFGFRAYVQGEEAKLVQQAQAALASGDAAAAEQAATAALALTPAGFRLQTNLALAVRGEALVTQQKYAAALPDLNTALAADPQNAVLLERRGQAYLGEGQVPEALADFSASLAIDPQNAKLFAQRGLAYLDEGQVKEALADFSASLALNPEQPALLDTQARTALQIGDLKTARAAAASAGELDISLSLPYAFQAETLYTSFRFSETITAASQSIQLKNPPALAYRLRGGAYYWLYIFSKAKPDLAKALELDPKDAEAAALLALMAVEANDADGLKTSSELAATIAPGSVPGLLAQAAHARYHYDYSQARSLIAQAILLSPERPELYILRSSTYTSSVDESAKLADIEKAISLAPHLRTALSEQAYWLLFMDELDEALKIGEQLVADFPAGRDGYLILGSVHARRYELTQALDIIETGLASAGESPSLYNSRGDIYMLMQKTDEARSDYEKALSLQPDGTYSLASLGQIAFENGDHSVALERYQQALDLDPQNLYLYLSRARIYADQEQNEKARADRQQAAALDAQNRWLVLDEAGRQLDENKYSDAVKKLEELIKRYPQWPEAQIILSWGYFYRGDHNLARREVKSTLELVPNAPDAHYLLGVLEMLEGKYDLALDEVEKILAIQPLNANAYALQGDIYRNQGEFDKAAASYNNSLEADPKLYSSYVSLAMVHITQEKNDQATKELKDALKGEPNPMAEILLESLENLPEGFKLYFQANYGYILAVPRDAEATAGSEGEELVMTFTYEKDDLFYIITLNLYESEPGQTDDPWFISGIVHEDLKQALPYFTEGELSEFQALNTSGVRHPYLLSVPIEGRILPLAGNMYFFSAEGRNMMIEFTTLETMANELSDLFDQIMSTFAFLP